MNSIEEIVRKISSGVSNAFDGSSQPLVRMNRRRFEDLLATAAREGMKLQECARCSENWPARNLGWLKSRVRWLFALMLLWLGVGLLSTDFSSDPGAIASGAAALMAVALVASKRL